MWFYGVLELNNKVSVFLTRSFMAFHVFYNILEHI